MTGQSFKNKTVVVTGATRGIGQALALAFAREGALVVGIGRSSHEQTQGLIGAEGGKYEALEVDLGAGGRDEMAAVIFRILRLANRIDVLVNNAGIVRRAPAVEFSEKDWDEVMRVNLKSPFFLSQAVAAWWLREGCGQSPSQSRLRIIFVASVLSFQGGILVPAYTASKHGIAGLTKALANEWAAHRINVNAIAPGYIATENTQVLREDPVRNKAILDRIPESRWGDSDDLAGACLLLASPAADYINGTILNVDGGWLAR